jgi:hypothetical protein
MARTTVMNTSSNAPGVALIVRLAGGGMLTAQQLNNIYLALYGDIRDAGYQFARNADAAHFLVTVRFTPDALDPSSGHVTVLGIEPNPMNRRGVAAVADESEETKEFRRRMREIERWAEAQAANRAGSD